MVGTPHLQGSLGGTTAPQGLRDQHGPLLAAQHPPKGRQTGPPSWLAPPLLPPRWPPLCTGQGADPARPLRQQAACLAAGMRLAKGSRSSGSGAPSCLGMSTCRGAGARRTCLARGYGGIRSVWGQRGRRRHGVEGVAEAPAGRPGEHGLLTGPGVLELRSQRGTSGRQGQEAKGEGQVPGSEGGEGGRPRPDQEGGPPAGAHTDPAAALLTTGRKQRHLGPTNRPAAMQPHSTQSPARRALSTRCSVRCRTQGHVACDPTSGTHLQQADTDGMWARGCRGRGGGRGDSSWGWGCFLGDGMFWNWTEVTAVQPREHP